MIVVLGHPALEPATGTRVMPDTSTGSRAAGEPGAASEGEEAGARGAHWLAGAVAVAAVAAGADVQLVGTIGDDPEGDAVVVALGRAGVGHAALLRDPGGRTPIQGAPEDAGRPASRLDARDVELGLGYLVEYGVLILAEPLGAEAEAVALEAAAYHDAAVIALIPEGTAPGDRLGAAATLLEAPSAPGGRFAELVGRYAAALDGGTAPAAAFASAVRATGWEPAGG